MPFVKQFTNVDLVREEEGTCQYFTCAAAFSWSQDVWMNWFEGFLHSAPQYLAHVEAFIDFSEDELIEDGVLNRGMCSCLFSGKPR